MKKIKTLLLFLIITSFVFLNINIPSYAENNDTVWESNWNYGYTGNEQIFTAPDTADYIISLYGAGGGGNQGYNVSGGSGGYKINVRKPTDLSVLVSTFFISFY